ncbi:SpoIIE family protein phosphatase [Streptomyces sp. NPDC048156]|uniref:SpoIIE family protein phosphatase n=1 Tax=Streptomyces sp. NPDC048156 TaxID=3365502 RepID=UPI00371719CE
MAASDARRPGVGLPQTVPGPPGGLMDVLGVAAVVLGADGRIVLWSPQAHDLFGWSPEEALGRYAADLLVAEEHVSRVLDLFAAVMAGEGAWAGVFPVLHKDGSTRPTEFRNMRLLDEAGAAFALGIACDEATVRDVERDLALSVGLVAQAPFGLAVLDRDLRYLLVNPTLERINGIASSEHLGRHVRETLPFLDVEMIESSMRQVLATGEPTLDQFAVGRTPADPDHDHAWSSSYYRLEDPGGRVMGIAVTVVDVTAQHRAAAEAAEVRRRLALIARASAEIGTSLDLEYTAHELAALVVEDLADIAAVDVLDAILTGADATLTPGVGAGSQSFRALAVAASEDTPALLAADSPGEIAVYGEDRLVTRCAATGRPVLLPQVTHRDLLRIARDEHASRLLAAAGVHSYLAVPLTARGQVLGVLDLKRTRNPRPFDDDDVAMADELASRAAVCIDNSRLYQRVRDSALTLQHHLLPDQPPQPTGLEIAYRYQPAETASGIGGDWFDAIPLARGRTALVVGDVMGHGINAAAMMGQLRTTTRALAGLELTPAQVLQHLDRATAGLEETIATCVYATLDPRDRQCCIALAGHLPPVLHRQGQAPHFLDLPAGVPLGVSGVPFHTTHFELHPGDRLILYTDGLVEARDESIDVRLQALVNLLAEPSVSLEATCDRLLSVLRRRDYADDVALVIAQLLPERG